MAYKFFNIPIQNSESAEEEFNSFLRSHTVLGVDRRWVDQGPMSFWSFCVDYLGPSGKGKGSRGRRDRGKVDYAEVLSPEDFAVYAKLRELRKEIAQAESVPVYTIFYNEQLAQMVQKKVQTKADLEGIGGVGDARIEKYGPRFLELLKQSGGDDEKSGEPTGADRPA
jgi:superfamily II DNA helicase RecQ